jgi:hypothetical protein
MRKNDVASSATNACITHAVHDTLTRRICMESNPCATLIQISSGPIRRNGVRQGTRFCARSFAERQAIGYDRELTILLLPSAKGTNPVVPSPRCMQCYLSNRSLRHMSLCRSFSLSALLSCSLASCCHARRSRSLKSALPLDGTACRTIQVTPDYPLLHVVASSP